MIEHLKRRRRQLSRIAVLLCGMLILGELVAEKGLGLNDPPLFLADPQIEYLYAPNQTCRQFGRMIHYNQWSMRSEDFPAHKANPNELRVMVVGDSIINGGSRTDQDELATSIIRGRLAARTARPVVVGNISAPSWGPPNQLEYAKRYGLFDADIWVIVWSSHDASDAPTFAPVVGVLPDYLDRKPKCALTEGFTRYFLFWFRHRFVEPKSAPEPPPDPRALAECASAESELIRMIRSSGARVIVVQHAEASESTGDWRPGHDQIRSVCLANGVNPVDDVRYMRNAEAAGNQVYRDFIHPNAGGQRVLAEVILSAITEAGTRPIEPPTGARGLTATSPATVPSRP